MTVYVDNMRARFGRMVMSHMIADTDDELHVMAARIGVARRWHQCPPKARDSHYDIAQSARAKAIDAGAVTVTVQVCGAMCVRRRVLGELGDPNTAEAWYRENCAVVTLPLAEDEVRCTFCRMPHPRHESTSRTYYIGVQRYTDPVCQGCAWRVEGARPARKRGMVW